MTFQSLLKLTAMSEALPSLKWTDVLSFDPCMLENPIKFLLYKNNRFISSFFFKPSILCIVLPMLGHLKKISAKWNSCYRGCLCLQALYKHLWKPVNQSHYQEIRCMRCFIQKNSIIAKQLFFIILDDLEELAAEYRGQII